MPTATETKVSTEYWQIECADNIDFMKGIESDTIDLIYCDILYGTGRKFRDYSDLPASKKAIDAFYRPRIEEMHRLLKKTGAIYLQMDTKINHWIRLIMDDVFGYDRFLNEISWIYRSQGFSKKKWSEKHDVILYYSKGKKWTFNIEAVRLKEIGASTLKRFSKEISATGKVPSKKNGKVYYSSPFSPPRDWLDINALPQAHTERNGYDTQKPMALVEQLILASSNEGDVVADFFVGSGTTAEVCIKNKRKIVACDLSKKAIEQTLKRVAKY